MPKPVPQAGQVLVRVHATSINPLDYQVRRGDYPDLVPLPAITGHDVSGVIEAVGAGVTAYAPGDEVWYTPQIFEGQELRRVPRGRREHRRQEARRAESSGGGQPEPGGRDGLGGAGRAAGLRVGRAS